MEDLDKAYERALRYLDIRARSRREMADYLARKGVELEVAEATLERLEASGLISDAAFAAAWVSERQRLRPRSRRVLTQELLAKGVSRDEVQQALAEQAPEAELEAAVAVAAKKQRHPQYADRDRLVAYLARQGYSYGVIKKALERLDT